jgi:proline iminopeptidase
MDRGVIERDGFKLTWVREGSGPPLIVVGSAIYYRRVFPNEIRQQFELFYFDSRQWAATPPGFDVSTLTLRDWSDDIEAMRVALGVGRPIVIGHSQHGCQALAYAEHYPTVARGVCAIASPPPFVDQAGQESAAQFMKRDADDHRKSVHRHNLATRPLHDNPRSAGPFIDNYVAGGALAWYDPAYDARPLWKGIDVINVDAMERLFSEDVLGTWQLHSGLPIFLALGRYDYGIPYFHWDGLRKRLPNLEYHLYERSAHTPPLEQPAEFAADFIRWADSVL